MARSRINPGKDENKLTGDKLWADAVRRAVKRRAGKKNTDPQFLDKLADKLVLCALAGDISAMREIGDRLDGKPKQSTELSGTGGGPVSLDVEVTFVEPRESKS